MPTPLDQDLKKLHSQAFDLADWTEPAIRRYHAVTAGLERPQSVLIRKLCDWLLAPFSLWPLNLHEVFEVCLSTLEKRKKMTSQQQLIIELLPEPPSETVCAAVTAHEFHVQKGSYENLVKTQVKYNQNELAIRNDPELRRQWKRIKAAFDVKNYCDHKGVIRRTMTAERNLRASFSVDLRQPKDAFQAAFDAFCLRWNLYGVKHDEPLLLKLAVNITPFGTMIHIPAYWSFDTKRDIQWPAIAKLHGIRVHGRQGSALAEGLAERRQNAAKLRQLDQEVRRLGLRGDPKHEFLCRGLGWVPGTDPKRFSRLRAEFKNR
ncbi:MAG: hypothetical protein WCS94_02535 [Verrucomicrobiota bacterium]